MSEELSSRQVRREFYRVREENRLVLATVLSNANHELEHQLALGAAASATDVEGALLSREDAYRAYKAVAPPTVIELWYFIRELSDWEPELVLMIKWIIRPRFTSRECKTVYCIEWTLSKTGRCPSCRRGHGKSEKWSIDPVGCGLKGCGFYCVCGVCECKDGETESWEGLCYWCT
jgi:hypothetical protein